MSDHTVDWQELIVEASDRLHRMFSDTATREAQWIAEEASGLALAQGGADRALLATVGAVGRFDALLARRMAGEPLQYVLGHWPFRRLDLLVDPRVLIPRPETEALVDDVLAALDEARKRLSGVEPAIMIDLGTGSGAIGLSVAEERRGTRVILTDVSEGALSVARANLAGLGRHGTTVEVVAGSWYGALAEELRGHVDVIASNPPYVGRCDEVAEDVVNWEPSSALFSGEDGLDDVRLIVAGAADWLRPGGVLVLEIGAEQAALASALCDQAGLGPTIVNNDLSGRPRVLRTCRADGSR